MIRLPLEVENKKPKRQIPVWVLNVAGLVLVVVSVTLTWIVLAAVID